MPAKLMSETKTKTIQCEEHYIKLDLSIEEAVFLTTLLNMTVGGHPGSTARKYSDSIRENLESIGLDYPKIFLEGTECLCPRGSDIEIENHSKKWLTNHLRYKR